MNERDWLTCGDPARMLAFLRDRATERKLRLFAIHTGRRWEAQTPRLQNRPEFRLALDLADQLAEGGTVAESEVVQVRRALEASIHMWGGGVTHLAGINAGTHLISTPVRHEVALTVSLAWCRLAAHPTSRPTNADIESLRQARLLQELFGNPFQPSACDELWLTTDVLAIAKGIYQDRAFDRMPILADALQDAGCSTEVVLNHCRAERHEHVRGCWVIDMLLGKI